MPERDTGTLLGNYLNLNYKFEWHMYCLTMGKFKGETP